MNFKIFMILLIYMVFILWLSTQPIPENAEELFPYQDKVFHFIIYSIFATIVHLGMKKSSIKYSCLTLWIAPIILSATYGTFIEICQVFVPTRSFEINDILVNTLGGISGSSLIQMILRVKA